MSVGSKRESAAKRGREARSQDFNGGARRLAKISSGEREDTNCRRTAEKTRGKREGTAYRDGKAKSGDLR